MPGLLTDREPTYYGNRDPERSGDAGPVYDVEPEPVNEALQAYAQQLWRTLDEVAHYLLDEVARGGSGPVLAERGSLLLTEDQWQGWSSAYAGTLGVLAGPAGDHGYGAQEAQLEYQNGYLYRQAGPDGSALPEQVE